MLRVLSYVFTLLNFALFLLAFVVTRDLYQTLFAFFYRLATAGEMSAFRVSALLRTFDMVSLFVLGLAMIVLTIVIQAAYERARGGTRLGARFALVTGLQLTWIGATRVLVWLIPANERNLILDGYALLPLAAGGAAVVAGIMLRRRPSAS